MFSKLAISRPADLIYGVAPRPVSCGFDLTIGDDNVYPEVNFTLPTISIEASTWSKIVGHYEQMAADIVRRSLSLKVPGLVLEFELLPAMTEEPEWGAEITAILHRHLKEAHEKSGLRCALRVTPTDMRDKQKPPVLREGVPWENVRRSFELTIEAGADIVSIESVGGKEVHDEGLMYGDLRAIVFALGVLADEGSRRAALQFGLRGVGRKWAADDFLYVRAVEARRHAAGKTGTVGRHPFG